MRVWTGDEVIAVPLTQLRPHRSRVTQLLHIDALAYHISILERTSAQRAKIKK